MIKKKIDKYFTDRGFLHVDLHIDYMELYYIGREESVSLVWVIEEEGFAELDADAYSDYASRIRETFVKKEYKTINLLTLFISHEPRKALEYGFDIPFWVVDEKYGRVVVYENMPEDYEGIRLPLENMLRVIPDTTVNNYGRTGADRQTGYEETQPDAERNVRSIQKVMYRPFITQGLVIINAIIFLLTDLLGSKLGTEKWLTDGAVSWMLAIKEHEYYRFFTCMFLHADISHIMGNMVGLYALGEILEAEFGHIKFLLLYLLSGAAAAVGSSMFYMHKEELVQSIGASGAIFGLVGMLAVFFIFNKDKFGSVGKPRIILFLSYMVYSLIPTGREGAVDNAAHAFGLVAGSVLCFAVMFIAGIKKKNGRA